MSGPVVEQADLVWRLNAWSVVTMLAPIAMFAVLTAMALGRVLQPDRATFDIVWLVIVSLAVLVSAGVLGWTAARSQTRLTPAGLETRQWSTQTFPYTTIVDVWIDRGSDDKVIRVMLIDDSTFPLPAPTRGFHGARGTTLDDAVTAIRSRCGLQPSRLPRLP